MVKRLMLVIVLALLVATGCNDTTAWVMTAPDSDANFRLGTMVGENAEVVGEVGYDSSSFNNDGTPDRFGVLLIYHLTQELHWEDTPDPSPFAGILQALQARPYVGAGPMMARGDQRLEGKWVAGTTFADHPDRPWAFNMEYQDGDGMVTARDDSAVFFGFRIQR